MKKLPENWSLARLVDLLSMLPGKRFVHQGWSPQCESDASPNENLWAVLKTTAVQDGKFFPAHNKRLPIGLKERPLLEVSVGDLLITCAGPRARCGVACLVRSTRPKLMISGKMYRMRVLEDIADARYVEAALRMPVTRAAIDGMKTGISESGMNLTHERFARLQIPLAPFPEQRRIADKLDAVLTRVESCRDHLDRFPTVLNRFRKSVISFATSGKLTAEWRYKRDVPSTWQTGTLASLLNGKPRNGYSPRTVEYATPVKSLALTATTTGRFRPQYFKYVDEEIPSNSHLWLQPGDILIQRANTIEYVGISAVYDGPSAAFIYPDLMMKARANAQVETKFLHYLLLSDTVRRHFRENATGTAGNMPKINQQTVLSAPVAWPSRTEQVEIVRRVESLFAWADSLEARCTAARSQVERLTPALLAKAFRGELVPQDPADEPASELLKRLGRQPTDDATGPAKRRNADFDRTQAASAAPSA